MVDLFDIVGKCSTTAAAPYVRGQTIAARRPVALQRRGSPPRELNKPATRVDGDQPSEPSLSNPCSPVGRLIPHDAGKLGSVAVLGCGAPRLRKSPRWDPEIRLIYPQGCMGPAAPTSRHVEESDMGYTQQPPAGASRLPHAYLEQKLIQQERELANLTLDFVPLSRRLPLLRAVAIKKPHRLCKNVDRGRVYLTAISREDERGAEASVHRCCT